jgi:hypothetical protein
MTIEANFAGETLVLNYTNSMYVAPPELSVRVFAEDSRNAVIINFLLNGVAATLPLSDIVLIADGEVVSNIRDYTLNVANWQTEMPVIQISKTKVNWQHMTVQITAHGQTIVLEYVNNMFEAE